MSTEATDTAVAREAPPRQCTRAPHTCTTGHRLPWPLPRGLPRRRDYGRGGGGV